MKNLLLALCAAVLLLAVTACQAPLGPIDSAAPTAAESPAFAAPADSRSVSLWYLENYMKNATSLSQIAGVYWSARDMDSSPIGNHHFITIIYESATQAAAYSAIWGVPYRNYANQKGLQVYYTTIGGFTDNGAMSGNIVMTFNQGSDCDAVKEQINPKKYIYWYKPDYDFEGHRVPVSVANPAAASLLGFMQNVVAKAKNFNAHHDAGQTVAYVLYDENCACMINSIFSALGVSNADRVTLGEFTGVDWGEEDLISASYFD